MGLFEFTCGICGHTGRNVEPAPLDRLEEAICIPRCITPTDPNLVEEEKPRLRGLALAVFGLFLDNPQVPLGPIREVGGACHTRRISDIRAAGHIIKLIDKDHSSGLTLYEYRGTEADLCVCSHTRWAHHPDDEPDQVSYCRELCTCPLFEKK